MLVNSPRIFGKKDKFFTIKSKVLKRHRSDTANSFSNSPLRIIAILVLAAALFLGARYLINNYYANSVFIVEKIVVEGNEFVSDDMIMKAARAEKGGDLYRLDIYDAKLRIEKIPQIYSASIIRKLPDTLIIQVVERSARAIIKTRQNNHAVCVDSEGVLLPEAASGGIDDMTTIYGVELDGAGPGQYCSNESLVTILSVLKMHDSSKLKEQVNVEAVFVEKDGEICIHEREIKPARRLYKVHLGKDDLEQRLANLAEILEFELKRIDRQDRIIDLTFERPLSTPVKSAEGI